MGSLSASLGALAIAVLIVVVPIGAGAYFVKSAINDIASKVAAANSRNPPSSTPYALPTLPSDPRRSGR